MEKILQSYLRRLTNLSGNNRSLLLLRLISDQFLDLHDLDFAYNQPSFQIIQGIIGRKERIKLCDDLDPRDNTTNAISQKLRKIQRIENFIFAERGARDLYVGWPFIRGKFADGTLVRCPLLFFPVSLEKEKNEWYLSQREDVNVTFNKTFLLAYSYYNKVALDEELIESTLNHLDKDSTVYRTQLYEMLKGSQLEINFNQENFIDKLHGFGNFKKADFDLQQKEGELKMFPEAVLGIFPQAGSYLVPDYVKLMESTQVSELADFFIRRVKQNPEEAQVIRFSDQVREETTFTPFEIDASQEYALKLIKNGNSLVVQGPPGTGKSQLICNLISDFIARGKNVLLVCQKRAALDVVYERLRQQELHDFIGLVHDFKNDRKSIFEQIARQIDSLDEYRQKNNGLDAIHLERTFNRASRTIDQVTEELEDFKAALFDESECGKSVKELYLTSDPDAPSFHISQEYRNFHYHQVPDFTDKLSRFLDYYEKFEKTQNFWISGPSFASFSTQDFIRVKEILKELPAYHEGLRGESREFSKVELDYDTSLHFLALRKDLELLLTNLDNDRVFRYYKNMLKHEPRKDTRWLSEVEKTMLQCFKGSGMETSLFSEDLGRFQEALEHALRARKGLFSWLRWKWFSRDKIFVTRVLVKNELKTTRAGFEVLLERMDNRLNYEHQLSEIQQLPWLMDFPTSFRKIDIQNWFFYQKLALKCIELTTSIRTIDQVLPAKNIERKDHVRRIRSLIRFLDRIPVQLQLWSRYLSESQVRMLLLGNEDLQAITRMWNEDFDALVEYYKLKDNFTHDENKIISVLLETGFKDKQAAIELFHNSLALAWIDHIETKYPILRAVSSFRLDHLTADLQQAILEKTRVSKEILLLKSRERTYENLEYNRLNNLVTYRDLYHQVTKKKQVWPIRRVISQYQEEVFSLLPCWMASPESASAIFPMEEIFDLVIFDEASQCFAERGIPAMYRGKQVVIAGDDKQLQPNDLYRVRWEEEETGDQPELEVDSLLALGKQYLKEVSLRGHYRSKSLELIEFSNINFYGGKLKLLPDFLLARQQKPAIHYIKKDGVWDKNVNMVEAQEVVDLVAKLAKEKPEKSIGVVTFNASQQGYILDLMEKYLTELGLIFPDSLFVKNIENVQGDERDIIIFTTAYAPDIKGKLQLRFGSLNMAGGENRLNVAVTRAREEIYIVTSLLPSQLNTDQAANAGPKLLKLYLEYAWAVSNGKWKPDSQEDKSHSQDWYLRKKLEFEAKGIQVTKELPYADLTVKHREEYRGLILTDDELFFDTLSPKETYSYRLTQFIQKNWPYHQFYSREYWINRMQTKDRLQKFIGRTTDD